MIKIVRGNDFAFVGHDRQLCVRFGTDMDLTGWSAEFRVQDVTKKTDDITDHIWTFGFTAEESYKFSLGRTYGKLILTDPNGHVRQVTKTEVEVVTPMNIDISMESVVANYHFLTNKPRINGRVVDGFHSSEYYLIPSEDRLNDKIMGITEGYEPFSRIKMKDSDGKVYTVRIVKRDDGSGTLVPTFAIEEASQSTCENHCHCHCCKDDSEESA